MQRGWLGAYDFATRRGAQFLGEYARSADPFARMGERTVSVQVTSVVRASDTSFQVKWTETVFERGSQTGTSRWTRTEERRVGQGGCSTGCIWWEPAP